MITCCPHITLDKSTIAVWKANEASSYCDLNPLYPHQYTSVNRNIWQCVRLPLQREIVLSAVWIKSVIKSIRIRWAGHVAHMGEERGVYRVLVGKPERKRPLGRPRRRWVDNIRMDLQEVGCGYMDWIGRAQDRDRWRTLVSAVMNLRVP